MNMIRSAVIAAWLAVLGLLATANAGPVDSNMAATTVRGWLKLHKAPLGESLGGQVEGVEAFRDKSGNNVFYAVSLYPSGFVIVPAEDSVEPIIAFSSQGAFDPSLANPLAALVHYDLSGRVAHARMFGLGETRLKERSKWHQLQQTLSSSSAQLQTTAASEVSDVRVAPFIQTDWDQLTANNGLACYNYYTPPYASGNANNYYCGCVATATAQLIRYFQYPTTGVGTASFSITVNGAPGTRSLLGGDGAGGAYVWSEHAPESQQPERGAMPGDRRAHGRCRGRGEHGLLIRRLRGVLE